MSPEEGTVLTERSNTLRSELKVWEKNFAAANSGHKASRDDIKRHPDIGMDLDSGRYKFACKC